VTDARHRTHHGRPRPAMFSPALYSCKTERGFRVRRAAGTEFALG
jgi:hypothetical protein